MKYKRDSYESDIVPSEEAVSFAPGTMVHACPICNNGRMSSKIEGPISVHSWCYEQEKAKQQNKD